MTDKVIDINDARKPVLIASQASGAIIGSIVVWLLRLHFPSWPDDGFSKYREHFKNKLNFPEKDVDQVMDFLENCYDEFKRSKKEDAS